MHAASKRCAQFFAIISLALSPFWVAGCNQGEDPAPRAAVRSQTEEPQADKPAPGTVANPEPPGEAPKVAGGPALTSPRGGPSPPVAQSPQPKGDKPIKNDPAALQAFVKSLTSRYPVPDGSPTELLAFIEKLDRRGGQGATEQEAQLDLQFIRHSLIVAADKVLASDARESIRLRAAQVKLDSLRLLAGMDGPGIHERLGEFLDELRRDKQPMLAALGRQQYTEYLLAEVHRGKKVPPEKLVALGKQLAAAESQREAEQARQVAAVLYEQGQQDDAQKIFQLVSRRPAAKLNQGDVAAGAAAEKLADLDFEDLVIAVIDNKPQAEQAFIAALDKMLSAEDESGVFLAASSQAADQLEAFGKHDLAAAVHARVVKAYAGHKDKELARSAKAGLERFQRRRSLPGRKLAVTGAGIGGKPLDWKSYEGKVVLVDFWATWCRPCLAEMPHLKELYGRYHDRGFEIVGVSLDDLERDRERVKAVLDKLDLPWAVVFDQAQAGQQTLAEQCGVAGIPFVVLIGRDGRVIETGLRGQQLENRLEQLLGRVARRPKPGATSLRRAASRGQFLALGAEAEDAAPAGDNGQNNDKPANPNADSPDDSDSEAPAVVAANVNPYSPRKGLSAFELVNFIFDMEEKTESIRRRDGFAEAIVEAADRILADKTAKERFKIIAIQSKFKWLHRDACLGDAKAEERLAAFLKEMKDDQRKQVAAEVAFLTLERRAIEADKLPLEKIPDLLEDLKKFFAEQELTERHLRIASNTVRAINRLADGETREKYFAEFGKLIAKAKDKRLASYGRRLAKPAGGAGGSSKWVGKELEITGVTMLGPDFDWKSYRGKVVLVEFWATWCGPCIKKLPEVKALHKKYKDQGFEVVGISLDKKTEAVTEFMEKHKLPWTILVGESNQDLAKKYGVRGIPTMFLVDREGKVVSVGHGLPAAEQIEKLLAKKNVGEAKEVVPEARK